MLYFPASCNEKNFAGFICKIAKYFTGLLDGSIFFFRETTPTGLHLTKCQNAMNCTLHFQNFFLVTTLNFALVKQNLEELSRVKVREKIRGGKCMIVNKVFLATCAVSKPKMVIYEFYQPKYHEKYIFFHFSN